MQTGVYQRVIVTARAVLFLSTLFGRDTVDVFRRDLIVALARSTFGTRELISRQFESCDDIVLSVADIVSAVAENKVLVWLILGLFSE